MTTTSNSFYAASNDKSIDHARAQLFRDGEYYESVMTSVFQSILMEEQKKHEGETDRKKRPIMLDVGGNIGWFSLLAAAHGAEVFAFEPNVVNMVRFCESQILNHWAVPPTDSNRGAADNRIHVFLKGVSNEHGTSQKIYKMDARNPGSFTFSQELVNVQRAPEVEGGALPLVTLDALAEDQGWLQDDDDISIAILKVDVEGLELKVLQGAKELLKTKKIKNIFLELKSDHNPQDLEEMFAILFDSGYELYKFGNYRGPNTAITKNYEDGKDLAKDVVARMFGEHANAWIRLKE